jgi:hypothetical protein
VVGEDDGQPRLALSRPRAHPPAEDALVLDEVAQLAHVERVDRRQEVEFEDGPRVELDVVDRRLEEEVLVRRPAQRVLAEAEPPRAVILPRHDPLLVDDEARDYRLERLSRLVRRGDREVDLAVGQLQQLQPRGAEHLLGQPLPREAGLREVGEHRVARLLVETGRGQILAHPPQQADVSRRDGAPPVEGPRAVQREREDDYQDELPGSRTRRHFASEGEDAEVGPRRFRLRRALVAVAAAERRAATLAGSVARPIDEAAVGAFRVIH